MSLLSDSANPAEGAPGEAITLEQAAERIRNKAEQPEPRERPTPQPAEDDQATEDQTDGGEPEEGEAPADGEATDEAADSEEAEDDAPADDLDLTRKVKVKVNGKEVEIPLSEALAGYQREADYRQKTQAAAEQRRAAEEAKRVADEHAAAVQAERQHLAQVANAYKTQLLGSIPTEAQLAELRRTNPTQFLITMEDIRGKVARVQAIEAEVGQVAQRSELERRQARIRAEEAAHEALSKEIAEWVEPDKRKSLQNDMAGMIRGFGYTDTEISQITDARLVRFALKAMRDAKDAEAYRALKARNPRTEQRVAEAPQVARPGAAVSRTAVAETRVRDLQKQAAKTGRIDTVAALIAAKTARK